jgi:DNA (cytosine-5)-methyltransferase 1
MVKYSEIKNALGLKPESDEDSRLAYFTHRLQNSYEPEVATIADPYKDYGLYEELDSILREPPFQGRLPIIEWDIPFPGPKKPAFKFIDLFAGIGGNRIAYQNLGGRCVFSSEWDKFAKKTYEANFGEVPFGDISKIDESEIPNHDILLAGFPCQPFSIAGVSKKNSLGMEHGFLDKTQGTLFFDIARIIQANRPKAFMLENVKNLLTHDRGKTFKVIAETLRELNYTIHYKILDGKKLVPQHRERIFIVGFDNFYHERPEEFEFPALPDEGPVIRDILEDDPPYKYTLSDKLWNYLQSYSEKHKSKGNGFGFGLTNPDDIARTLSARYFKDGSEVLIPQKNMNPRKLTPRECARLMGFPDSFIIPVSDNQAYKQFGNSVIAPLVELVGTNVVSALSKKAENERDM